MLETTLPLLRCSNDAFESATLTWDYEAESGSLTVGCETVTFGIEKLESGSCLYLNLPDGFEVVDDKELNIEVWSGPAGQAWLERDIILRTIEENTPKKVPILEDGYYIFNTSAIKQDENGIWQIPAHNIECSLSKVPNGPLTLDPGNHYGTNHFYIYHNWPLVWLAEGTYRIVS